MPPAKVAGKAYPDVLFQSGWEERARYWRVEVKGGGLSAEGMRGAVRIFDRVWATADTH